LGDDVLNRSEAGVVRHHSLSLLIMPSLIEAAGETATRRFPEFFTAQIRNPNTRAAYARAITSLLDRSESRGVRTSMRSGQSSWRAISRTSRPPTAPTVKQHLAAIHMIFDWLVVGQNVESNPASALRRPKHVVKRGKGAGAQRRGSKAASRFKRHGIACGTPRPSADCDYGFGASHCLGRCNLSAIDGYTVNSTGSKGNSGLGR
jgi:hypothetical protein